MAAGGAALLRVLAGGVRPVDAPAPPTRAGPRDRDTLDFGLLLERATRGGLRTDLPVRLPASLRADFDAEAMTRLSEATDLAAAEGIRRAAVIMGGRVVRVDVAARSVVDAPDAQQAAIGGIDGVVRLPGTERTDGSADGDPGSAGGPARVVRNASLARTLADVGDGTA